jgi:hypothetical protein
MAPVSAGPTRSSVLNSRKILAFTTSQQIWNSSINLVSSAYTIFCVSRLTGTTNARVLSTSYTGATGTNWLLGHWSGQVNQYYAEGWVQYQGYAADTVWRIYMGDWSGSSTDLANLYSNGTAIATNSNGANAGPLGLGVNISSEVSTCEAAEIIVFNRTLSITERRQINTYLGQKWGILNTDRSIIDLSGNNYNGLLGNGTTANMPLLDYYNKGALKFDGSNDYVKLGISTGFNQFSGNFTVSLWAMANAVNANYGNLIGDYYTAGVATLNEWQIMMNNSSTALNVYRHNTGYIISNTASGFSANTWINVVLTRVGSIITLYANNNIIGTANNSSVFGSATGSVNIGMDGNNTSEPFSGFISNVLIYNKGLSAAEVAQNYEAQKSKFVNPIVQQGLVLNLDAGNPYSYAGSGATWYDTSGNANNATLINSPTYSTDNGGLLTWTAASSQYATVAMNSGLRVAYITEEVWVYLTTTANQVFIGMQYGNSSNNSFAIWLESGYFRFGVNTGGSFYNNASSAPSAGAWYHLVHTYAGSVQYFYINGVQINAFSSSASGNITYDTSNTKLAIAADFNGAGYDSGAGFFVNGKMPIVRIYNIELSATQVLQNFNAMKGRFGL